MFFVRREHEGMWAQKKGCSDTATHGTVTQLHRVQGHSSLGTGIQLQRERVIWSVLSVSHSPPLQVPLLRSPDRSHTLCVSCRRETPLSSPSPTSTPTPTPNLTSATAHTPSAPAPQPHPYGNGTPPGHPLANGIEQANNGRGHGQGWHEGVSGLPQGSPSPTPRGHPLANGTAEAHGHEGAGGAPRGSLGSRPSSVGTPNGYPDSGTPNGHPVETYRWHGGDGPQLALVRTWHDAVGGSRDVRARPGGTSGYANGPLPEREIRGADTRYLGASSVVGGTSGRTSLAYSDSGGGYSDTEGRYRAIRDSTFQGVEASPGLSHSSAQGSHQATAAAPAASDASASAAASAHGASIAANTLSASARGVTRANAVSTGEGTQARTGPGGAAGAVGAERGTPQQQGGPQGEGQGNAQGRAQGGAQGVPEGFSQGGVAGGDGAEGGGGRGKGGSRLSARQGLSAVSEKLLAGWAMMEDYCPACLNPLMRNR